MDPKGLIIAAFHLAISGPRYQSRGGLGLLRCAEEMWQERGDGTRPAEGGSH